MADTGFDLHIDIAVDHPHDRPRPATRKICRQQLDAAAKHRGRRLQQLEEKWFPEGDRWLWVIGARFANAYNLNAGER